MKIYGETMALCAKEMRFFKTVTNLPMINEIQAGTVMEHLAGQQQNLLCMEKNPCQTGWTLPIERRSFEKRLEIFMPVAAAILLHETEQVLFDKTRGATEDTE